MVPPGLRGIRGGAHGEGSDTGGDGGGVNGNEENDGEGGGGGEGEGGAKRKRSSYDDNMVIFADFRIVASIASPPTPAPTPTSRSAGNASLVRAEKTERRNVERRQEKHLIRSQIQEDERVHRRRLEEQKQRLGVGD